MRRRRAALGLLALSVGLRASGIGLVPPTDEAITVEMVSRFGLLEMPAGIPQAQPHLPLYYMILKIWSYAAPVHSAKAISVVAGSAVAPAAYWWFCELTEEWRARRAGLLLAIAPPLVVQSGWLRMYALLTLAVLLSWWASWRWLEGRGRASTYACLAVATIGLHPFGAAAVGAQLTWLAVEQRQDGWRRHFRSAVAVAAAATAAGASILLARVAGVDGFAAIGAKGMHIRYASDPVRRAVVLPLAGVVGTSAHVFATLGMVGATAAVAASAYRRRAWRSRHGRLWLCWVVCGIGLLYVGHLLLPIIMLKYTTWTAPAVALAAATALPESWRGHAAYYFIIMIASRNLAHAGLSASSVAIEAIRASGVSAAL